MPLTLIPYLRYQHTTHQPNPANPHQPPHPHFREPKEKAPQEITAHPQIMASSAYQDHKFRQQVISPSFQGPRARLRSEPATLPPATLPPCPLPLRPRLLPQFPEISLSSLCGGAACVCVCVRGASFTAFRTPSAPEKREQAVVSRPTPQQENGNGLSLSVDMDICWHYIKTERLAPTPTFFN